MESLGIDRQRVADLYRSGFSAQKIAETLGCSCGTVFFHLRKAGVETRPNKTIDWPIDQMRQWYEQEGLTVSEIGQRLGVSPKVVNKACKRLGFRMRRRGPKSGRLHKGWKGGRTLDKSGYVLVFRPEHPQANSNGYIREHRLVAEKMLGRAPFDHEVVHHKDGNRQNNDPSNLQVFDSNAEHLRETLTGKVPRWTPAGLARIRQANAEWRRSLASRRASELDAQESR